MLHLFQVGRWPALLVLTVVATYWGVLSSGFVSDDWPAIANNSVNLDSIGKIPSFFTSGVWAHTAVANEGNSIYRPLWLTWNVGVYAFAGTTPALWHAVSLALHVLNSLLILLLVGRLFPDSPIWQRSLVTGLFALHPAVSESVAWVAGSTDLLLLAVALGTLLCHMTYRQNATPWAFLGTAAFYAMALLTKEPAIMLPLVLVAYDLWQKPTRVRALPWRLYGVLGGISLAYLVIRAIALGGEQSGTRYLAITGDGVLRLAEYWLLYFRHILAPWDPPHYLRHAEDMVAAWELAIGAIACLILIVAAWRVRLTRFAAVWLLLPLSVPAALAVHEFGFFAIRYLYFPLAALPVIAMALLQNATSAGRKSAGFAIVVLLAYYVPATAVAVTDWRDEETWAREVIARDPQSVRARISLARHYAREKNSEAALAVYSQGAETVTNLDDKVLLSMRKASTLNRLRRFDEAREVYQWISQQDGYQVQGLIQAGNLAMMLGREQEADANYRRILGFETDHPVALFRLGLLAERRRDALNAREFYQRFMALPAERRSSADSAHAGQVLDNLRRLLPPQ